MRSRSFVTSFVLALLVAFLGIPAATAEDTPYFDGSTLRFSKTRDETAFLKLKEWQIWLYKRGEQPGHLNHWGTISAASEKSVLEKLKASQRFEIQYCRFFRKPDNCESDATYFNPLGPIAIVGNAPSTAQQIITIGSRLQDFRQRLGKLLALRESLTQPYSPSSYSGQGSLNPYAGMGTYVLEYGKDLSKGVELVKKLENMLDKFTGRSVANIHNELNTLESTSSGFPGVISDYEAANAKILQAYSLRTPKADKKEAQDLTRPKVDLPTKQQVPSSVSAQTIAPPQLYWLCFAERGEDHPIYYSKIFASDTVFDLEAVHRKEEQFDDFVYRSYRSAGEEWPYTARCFYNLPYAKLKSYIRSPTQYTPTITVDWP